MSFKSTRPRNIVRSSTNNNAQFTTTTSNRPLSSSSSSSSSATTTPKSSIRLILFILFAIVVLGSLISVNVGFRKYYKNQTDSALNSFIESKPNNNNNNNSSSDKDDKIILQSKLFNNIDIKKLFDKEYNNDGHAPLTGEALQRAITRSLQYIYRNGHDERVKWLIGFRQYNDVKIENYKQLSIRNQKTIDRNYETQPLRIKNWLSPPNTESPCDVPCKSCDGSNCDFHGTRYSMENVYVAEQDGTIAGNTKLSSQVPVPYMSWHDFGFMAPLNRKYKNGENGYGIAAAFISNCGFSKRNHMVNNLQKHGVRVDSYGRCEHNKDEKREGGRDNTKLSLLSHYKFSLAFENSETDDYITEKFFGTLVSGSIPVYIGAPNVKFYAPDSGPFPYQSHSVIWAGDFDFDAQSLAKYLLYLDGNDTAYEEYLQWKYDGYSGDFKAVVDLTSTHTACRQCNIAGDILRNKYGTNKYDSNTKNFVYGEGKILYVRERGNYRFIKLQIKENTIESLIEAILLSITKKPVKLWKSNDHPHYGRIGPAVYAIYHIPSKNVVHSNKALQNLEDLVELEVILV